MEDYNSQVKELSAKIDELDKQYQKLRHEVDELIRYSSRWPQRLGLQFVILSLALWAAVVIGVNI